MEKKKISIKELSKKFIPTIKKIINYFKKSDFNSKMKLLGEIVVLILLLCLLKLPFSIVRDLIINVFFSVEIANTLLMNMLYIVFGLPYYVLAIYLFVKTIVTRYENLEVKENKSNNISNTNNIDNTSTSNTAIEEKKEDVENTTRPVVETISTTVIENTTSTNNEQGDNINNSQ